MRSLIPAVVRGLALTCAVVAGVAVAAPATASADHSVYGPWNARIAAGSVGLKEAIPPGAAVLKANADWTAQAWVEPQNSSSGRQLIAGFGDPAGNARYLAVDHGKLAFWWGKGKVVTSSAAVTAGHWQHVAAVVKSGTLRLYLDGKQVAQAPAPQQAVAAEQQLGPIEPPSANSSHFGGRIADFSVRSGALTAEQLASSAGQSPGPLTRFVDAADDWPVQTRQMAGLLQQQPPSTLPHSKAPFSSPQAQPLGERDPVRADGEDNWSLGDWYLASATDLPQAQGASLSTPDAKPGKPWLAAAVPGTVLTTLIDRGVYPDPAYGLNNMAIPETLNKHDWWYRTTFTLPQGAAGRHLSLQFGGINYASEIWVNGQRVGSTKGAFDRGIFDVTHLLRSGQPNAIAVRVSPVPNPGLAQEESIAAGPGDNGGMEAMDGPTFIATEGWDWIPSIRDRDTGLWQGVTLKATGAATLGDPQVITHLPGLADGGHDLGRATVSIDVPLANAGSQPVNGELSARFGNVQVTKSVTVPPGGTVVHLSPTDYPQLKLKDPQLWWPNGYGAPHLYTLNLAFSVGGQISDQRQLHFGIREISYELSLFDHAGDLRRVLVDPERTATPGQRVVDVTHQGIHQTPNGWAYSLTAAGEHSPAVTDLPKTSLTPFLVLRVNGVRIAVKGGSWGTDDFMKRVSTAHLEPYFKLQRDAHLNVIRNWVGQSTESAFYDLADKYGMLVFNDFWQSTQNYNIEPSDDALFMRNAEDTIRRYRNHPSIALWFGRNEGVPQPLLNHRLDAAVAQLDGTRMYFPSSNEINLWKSGPYNYREPVHYFTDLAQGFAVELGTPSFPTLEAFKAMMPKADQWPISDDWAYHDWHQKGNGDVVSFMQSMTTKFGKPTSLADFNRKAQMMNYVTFRAIFEGFNAHLFTRDSGRLLWMSHPAWPSTMWQIYSHDYDTNASYYGTMHASEPVHVQMNLPDRSIAVVNTTTRTLSGLKVKATAYALDGHVLGRAAATVSAAPEATTAVPMSLNLGQLVTSNQLMFVHLALSDGADHLLSRNFYWTAAQPSDLRKLQQLPTVTLGASVAAGNGKSLEVTLRNGSTGVALNTKLTLVDASGKRILPAYYSDNYISLAPGEQRLVQVSADVPTGLDQAKVELRGWNVAPAEVSVGSHVSPAHSSSQGSSTQEQGKAHVQQAGG